MKRLIPFLLLPMLYGQDDIQSILERDPFDPDRGRKEELVTEPEEEAVEVPPDVPVLDGTIIIGEVRIAMLSFKKDGKSVSARVEMKGGGSDYLLYLRGPRANDEEGPAASFLGEPNGRLAGYTVARIEANFVELRRPDENKAFPIEMFVRESKQRGGTKKGAARAPSRRQPVPPTGQRGDQAPENGPNVNVVRDPNDRKPQFRRRLDDSKLSEGAREKKERIKTKF